MTQRTIFLILELLLQSVGTTPVHPGPVALGDKWYTHGNHTRH